MPKGGKPPVGRRFEKGKSGNPGGRPKSVAEVVLFARERSIWALKGIEATGNNPKTPPATRLACYTAMLERAWGKVPQGITVPDDLSQLSDEELREEARKALLEPDPVKTEGA